LSADAATSTLLDPLFVTLYIRGPALAAPEAPAAAGRSDMLRGAVPYGAAA
jgi:hypothetical protein